MNKVFEFLIILAVFLILDFTWIGFVAKKFYSRHLDFLMRKKPNWAAAIIFYLIFIFGISIFVLNPALLKGSWEYALLYGAVFGLVSYSTYDLTNMATIKNWPLKLTIVDLVWGTVLTAATSGISYFLIRLFALT